MVHLNPELLREAHAALLKQGFAPPEAAGAMPPPDPAAGGMPPGAPTGAPAAPPPAAGMAPPAAGAAPPPAPGMPPPAPGMPGDPAAAAAAMKPKKVDPAVIDAKLWQITKLLVTMCNHMDIKVPADIILGPPPDPMAMQQAVASSQGIDNQAMQGASGTSPEGGGAAGGQSAIQPPEPIQAAAPGMDAGGGAMKMGRLQELLPEKLPEIPPNNVGTAYDAPLASVSGIAKMAQLARSLNSGRPVSVA